MLRQRMSRRAALLHSRVANRVRSVSTNDTFTRVVGNLFRETSTLILLSLSIFVTISRYNAEDDLLSAMFMWLVNKWPSLCTFVSNWGEKFYEVPWYALIVMTPTRSYRLVMLMLAAASFVLFTVHWAILTAAWVALRFMFKASDPMIRVMAIGAFALIAFSGIELGDVESHGVYDKATCEDTDWSVKLELLQVGGGGGQALSDSRPDLAYAVLTSVPGKYPTVWPYRTHKAWITCTASSQCPDSAACKDQYCLLYPHSSAACFTGNAYDTSTGLCAGSTSAASGASANQVDVINYYIHNKIPEARSLFVDARLHWRDFPWVEIDVRDNNTSTARPQLGDRNSDVCSLVRNKVSGAKERIFFEFLDKVMVDDCAKVVHDFLHKYLPTKSKTYAEPLTRCCDDPDVKKCICTYAESMI